MAKGTFLGKWMGRRGVVLILVCLVAVAFVQKLIKMNGGHSFFAGGNPPSQGNQGETGDASSSGSGSVMKFVRVSIHDPEVNNIEACSILVPEGWDSKGGVTWDPNLGVQAYINFDVTDPQSQAEVDLLPLQYYCYLPNSTVPMPQGSNETGDIVWPPITDLEQYARTFYAPQVLPELNGAQLETQQDMPNIAALLQQSAGEGAQAKAGRVRFAYERDGQPWEEDIYLNLVYQSQAGMMVWYPESAAVVRAPRGQLDRMTPLMVSILHTVRLNQTWYSALMYVRNQFHERMMGQIADIGDISQMIAQNSDELRNMYSESYKAASDAEDSVNQSFSETIRGVNTYSDPYEGRPVELPSGYNDAWVNANGEYLLSNQAGYDPNVGATTEWRRMDQRGEAGQ